MAGENLDGMVSMEMIGKIVTTLYELKEAIFPKVGYHFHYHKWLYKKATLATKNDAVNTTNRDLLSQLPGQVQKYKSVDTVSDTNEAVNYPTGFHNSLEPPGVTPNNLEIKNGAPIMFLRNLEPPTLCNETRLAAKKLMPHVMKAKIMTGHATGQYFFISRISIIPPDLQFQFKHFQFPVRLSFTMSIKKHRGNHLRLLVSTCKAHVFLTTSFMLVTPGFVMARTFSPWHQMGKQPTLSILRHYKDKNVAKHCYKKW
ncbi:uncharacterized protein LOC106467243 [Limulus polyphemus]|uniref:Uncharacterized protein LOC106467243 n=1 Tax=Limulus polyphemus TaxID=6850 RepID=A0ABM1BJ50_LIMPO|nr:uncharacterized protein LOC106467243 [Limulus polyphemus]